MLEESYMLLSNRAHNNIYIVGGISKNNQSHTLDKCDLVSVDENNINDRKWILRCLNTIDFKKLLYSTNGRYLVLTKEEYDNGLLLYYLCGVDKQ